MPVSPLTLKDCVQAAHLHQAAFYKRWTKKDFQTFLNDPLVFGLKIEDLNTFSGSILWREVGDEAEILTLVVDPLRQRKGIGTLLLNTLLERLQEKGISKLFLEVAKDNEKAISFYLKNGFQMIGTRPQYYARPEQQSVDGLNLCREVGDKKGL